VLLGLFLDRSLHTAPLFLIIGILLGLAAATIGVYRLVMQELKD
jgi:F0F1-type ATP synthase assembly protein I